MGFQAFLALLRIKQLKLGLFCTKLGTQYYLVYIILLNWLEFNIIVICLKIRVKLRFYGFLSVFDTFAHKVAQTCFFFTKLRTQHYFVFINLLKWLELKIIFICYKLLVKLRFYGFLSVFVSFGNKIAQTLFVFHEIRHTTQFGIL